MKTSSLFAFVAFLLFGCGAPDVQPTPVPSMADDEAIVGGTPTTGDPSVVALYGAVPGANQGMLCTASVISPTVLLTAAHCVSPAVVGEGLQYIALFGYDITKPETQGDKIKVASVEWDPEFDVANLPNGHDIAVVILSKPTTVAPLPYNREPLGAAMVGDSARLVGYGLSSGLFSKGAGVKREATVKLNSFDGKFVKTGTLFKKICSGDSGGPVFMNIHGRETIVGVNSFGMIFCLSTASSTRVDSYLEFIQQFVP